MIADDLQNGLISAEDAEHLYDYTNKNLS